MKHQSGYVQLILILVLLSGAVTGAWAMISRYNTAIKNEQLALQEANRLKGENIVLQTQLEQKDILFEAEKERMNVQREREIENAKRAEQAVARANADKILETLNRDPQKYVEFVNKVLPHNIDVIRCRSDLSTVDHHADKDTYCGRIH